MDHARYERNARPVCLKSETIAGRSHWRGKDRARYRPRLYQLSFASAAWKVAPDMLKLAEYILKNKAADFDPSQFIATASH
jgi:hypothetical protein